MRFRKFFFVLFILFPIASWADPIVRAIDVKGNVGTPAETVLATIRSKVDQPYMRELVDADIKVLYRLGQFTDIRVEKQAAAGGVRLIYHVVEKPVIVSVRYEGNRKIKEKELDGEATVRPYKPLSEAELAETIEKIQALYTKKGYYLVDINYELKPAADGMELVFRIQEHGKSAVRRVQFVGNKAFSDHALKKVLRTKERGAFLFKSGKFREELLEQDIARLAYHYLDNGYLRVRIDTPRVDISKDRRHIFITFAVDEGKQYHIADVRVEGEILTTPEEIISRLKTKPKMLYKHSIVEEDMRFLTEFYGNEGYAYANIQPVPVPHDEDGTAELIFSVTKGKRITIERINILGNTTTRDKVIRRELKIKEGDLFNRHLIDESRARLMQLGFFEDIRFATPRGTRDDRANLNIEVKEKPTGTFNLGAGFSTAEDFFFTGSVQKQNFFGLGLSGQLAAEISKLRQQYVVQVTDPHFLDSEWILSLSSSRTIFRYPDYDRKAFGGAISLGHRLFEHMAVNFGYQIENVEAASFSFAVPELFRQNAKGLTSGVNMNVSYDTRDNRIFPTKGIYTMVNSELSGSKLGGDNDFFRINYYGRIYQPIKWGLVTKLYGRAGYIKSLGSRSIPLYERFFMGGPNSLRGFNLWAVGPKLRIPAGPAGGDADFVYGGNKMVQLNWELEAPIYAPGGFKAVVFFDAGNAFAEEQAFSFKNLRMNYGAGFRWVSPLGPLRFEWGFPIRRQPGESKVVFNFTIGDFF